MSGLSIAIVGAGIGGLTTALTLARQGHSVTLIERRPGFSEVGAGLQLSPNASRILVKLGLGPALRRVATLPERVVVRGISSGRRIGEVALGPYMQQRYGAPYWVVHRADLQTILLDAVRSEAAIRIVTGRKVEEVQDGPEHAQLVWTSSNGTHERLTADVVIGADGVWSKVRRAVGDTTSPIFHGYIAWRATLDRKSAPPELAGNETGLWLGAKGHVVHYPIFSGHLINVVAIEKAKEPVDGWAAPGRAEELLSHYSSAAPALRALLQQPQEWLRWSLFRHPIRCLAQGRIALMGDAAHPVLPFLAQGAALAIEDAATLGAVLAKQPHNVAEALAAYGNHRLERVRRIQAEGRKNGRIYHSGALVSFWRNKIMQMIGPESMSNRYDWIYGFHTPE
ncbi:FAD-dependent oxidoreductase [Microvirga guangxiensis]|uniref:Salicylate hydroxylase n=1 Tax=Microvirga guangxiensis TaxID=549386 RepID=A0A1G5LEF6_9HYPH|nr:FAD-dependent oxidoreductase [Microvirga guangxiensis]SCZ11242.1 salicylate hydroxylase [Microvirga guangxiensis]